MCIDIVDICFRIADGRISSFFDMLSAHNTSVFYFQDNNLSNSPWIFTKFDVCIDIVEIASCVRIAHQQILSISSNSSITPDFSKIRDTSAWSQLGIQLDSI